MIEDKRQVLKAWIALAPALFFVVFFMIYPIINTFLLSFMDDFVWADGAGFNLFANDYAQFGIQNYIYVLEDTRFIAALINTAVLVAIEVPLTIVVSLLIAVGLYNIKKLQGFYQTIFFLPYVTNSIALGMVFNVIFTDGQGGLFNQLMMLFGLGDHAWLSVFATKWEMLVPMVLNSLWNGLAFKVLVFMSGLASIDRQYYDAARVDGTRKARILGKITIPLLSPQIFYITITSFIGAFKMYTSVISLFGAGPYNFGGSTGDSWITLVGYIYSVMRTPSDVGLAAAGSMLLLILILIITGVQFYVSKKRVHY